MTPTTKKDIKRTRREALETIRKRDVHKRDDRFRNDFRGRNNRNRLFSIKMGRTCGPGFNADEPNTSEKIQISKIIDKITIMSYEIDEWQYTKEFIPIQNVSCVISSISCHCA